MASSRSTTFVAEALAHTFSAGGDGGGVGFVLNSLTSAGFVAASVAALLPHGRFAEIGKRSIWSHAVSYRT